MENNNKNKYLLGIFLILIIIILIIPLIFSADTGTTPTDQGTTPTATGSSSGTPTSGTDSQTTPDQTQNKGIKWESMEGGGKRASFTDANNHLTYSSGGKSYTIDGVKVPDKGLTPGYIDFDKDGNPTGASYQMGDKGSSQVFGKPSLCSCRCKCQLERWRCENYYSWKSSSDSKSIPSDNIVKGEPKTVSSNGNDVKVHYNIQGDTTFTDDNGVKKFDLRKGDEITHDGKNWQIEPGKTITPNGAKIPVGEDKAAVKFFPEDKIPADEKGSAVAISKEGKVSIQGSALESSPKVEISGRNDFFKTKENSYFSAQAGKGSSIDMDYNTKTSSYEIKPTGNSWSVIDGNKEFKGINGAVYQDTLKTPPAGMSADDFKKIKSDGIDILALDDKGKSVILDAKGNQYKISIDENDNSKLYQ